ncbi:hypothetical protein [Fodinicola feengrottensis]|uniref:hypothetical protein n=1 Tax=Fodinicola feengrottensis TaxID=435914 RepID=UPI002441DD3B|nr:hypothetical protein [Fodinicola feengrottensis]
MSLQEHLGGAPVSRRSLLAGGLGLGGARGGRRPRRLRRRLRIGQPDDHRRIQRLGRGAEKGHRWDHEGLQ